MSSDSKHPRPNHGHRHLALVLGGGGARAAYEVGVLRYLGKHVPEAEFQIITGVSAGALNAAYLASKSGSLRSLSTDLSELWSSLETHDVFDASPLSLVRGSLGWAWRLLSGGARTAAREGGPRALLDPTPLRTLLARHLFATAGSIGGVARKIRSGRLSALGVTTLDYATGITTTWVQGGDSTPWERRNRRSVPCEITLDHVLASAAIPLVFPAVRLDRTWHGDGGVRLTAPLSPALHLGADRILVVSTYHEGPRICAPTANVSYPPPAQILGHVMNAVFLDVLDQDVHRIRHLNEAVDRMPQDGRAGFRKVDVLALRPSQDLGRLAAQFEPRLPRSFRFLTRGLGTLETNSLDILSPLMFEPGYLSRLVDLGESDAAARADEIREFFAGPPTAPR